MIKTGVASNISQAAWKAKLVIGIIPMVATIYFTTEALPIGLVGILMPFLAYFFYLLPKKEIGKTFCGDAPPPVRCFGYGNSSNPSWST